MIPIIFSGWVNLLCVFEYYTNLVTGLSCSCIDIPIIRNENIFVSNYLEAISSSKADFVEGRIRMLISLLPTTMG